MKAFHTDQFRTCNVSSRNLYVGRFGDLLHAASCVIPLGGLLRGRGDRTVAPLGRQAAAAREKGVLWGQDRKGFSWEDGRM